MAKRLETGGRREFLGYCGATALLMSRFAAVWANAGERC